MTDFTTAMQYENKGYRQGKNARVKSTNEGVVLLSNPYWNQDTKCVHVKVAMKFDTHVLYTPKIDDIEIV
jgi:hypothetical protein